MFCKHEWELLKETLTESKLERAVKLADGGRCNSLRHWMIEQKLIQYFTCKKCGKLKRFVEEI